MFKKVLLSLLFLLLSSTSFATYSSGELWFLSTFQNTQSNICPPPCWRPWGPETCQCPFPD